MSQTKPSLETVGDNIVRVRAESPGASMTWTLCDTEGMNDWRATSVTIDPNPGESELTATLVRALPIRASLQEAKLLARSASRGSSRFSRVGDPPTVWREEGRGGKKRTEKDWAQLALAYSITAETLNPREIAARWAEEFGVAKRTWGNRIAEARSRGLLNDDNRLTGRAEDILFGNHQLAIEYEVGESERRLAGEWKFGEKERLHRNGVSVEEMLQRDRRKVAEFYNETVTDEGN